MKLSEAIRLGAMLKPQSIGGASDGETSCALQAACESYGENYFTSGPSLARRLLPGDLHCPECSRAGDAFWVIACCLNDYHHWTRERIADWVATIEAQQECIGHPAKTNTEDAALVSGAGQ